jgi:TatD DNase family protein
MNKRKKTRPPIPVIKPGSFLIDSHCHLDMESYTDDLDHILDRARSAGVQSIISIGIDEESSRSAIKIANANPMVKASVGVHPHDVENITEGTYQRLKVLISENRDQVVGYGEIGLDFAKQYAAADIQRKAFQEQLQLAKEMSLPLIIHDREAHEDTIQLLQRNGPFPHGGVMHCFSGDMVLAEQVLALGFYISIPGVVTFKNGQDLQEVARQVPLESLIIETDGPFLAPSPWRGKRNEPSYLPYTAAKIAELKDVSMEEVALQTSKNVERLFHYTVAPTTP